MCLAVISPSLSEVPHPALAKTMSRVYARPSPPLEVGLIRDRPLPPADIWPKVGHSGFEPFLPAAEDEDGGALLDERFAAPRPMPVAPPLITAVFPFSLFMSCIHTGSRLWLCGDAPRTSTWIRRSEALSAEARTSWCKSIQLDD